jgi:hypothetical protein
MKRTSIALSFELGIDLACGLVQRVDLPAVIRVKIVSKYSIIDQRTLEATSRTEILTQLQHNRT